MEFNPKTLIYEIVDMVNTSNPFAITDRDTLLQILKQVGFYRINPGAFGEGKGIVLSINKNGHIEGMVDRLMDKGEPTFAKVSFYYPHSKSFDHYARPYQQTDPGVTLELVCTFQSSPGMEGKWADLKLIECESILNERTPETLRFIDRISRHLSFREHIQVGQGKESSAYDELVELLRSYSATCDFWKVDRTGKITGDYEYQSRSILGNKILCIHDEPVASNGKTSKRIRIYEAVTHTWYHTRSCAEINNSLLKCINAGLNWNESTKCLEKANIFKLLKLYGFNEAHRIVKYPSMHQRFPSNADARNGAGSTGLECDLFPYHGDVNIVMPGVIRIEDQIYAYNGWEEHLLFISRMHHHVYKEHDLPVCTTYCIEFEEMVLNKTYGDNIRMIVDIDLRTTTFVEYEILINEALSDNPSALESLRSSKFIDHAYKVVDYTVDVFAEIIPGFDFCIYTIPSGNNTPVYGESPEYIGEKYSLLHQEYFIDLMLGQRLVIYRHTNAYTDVDAAEVEPTANIHVIHPDEMALDIVPVRQSYNNMETTMEQLYSAGSRFSSNIKGAMQFVIPARFVKSSTLPSFAATGVGDPSQLAMAPWRAAETTSVPLRQVLKDNALKVVTPLMDLPSRAKMFTSEMISPFMGFVSDTAKEFEQQYITRPIRRAQESFERIVHAGGLVQFRFRPPAQSRPPNQSQSKYIPTIMPTNMLNPTIPRELTAVENDPRFPPGFDPTQEEQRLPWTKAEHGPWLGSRPRKRSQDLLNNDTGEVNDDMFINSSMPMFGAKNRSFLTNMYKHAVHPVKCMPKEILNSRKKRCSTDFLAKMSKCGPYHFSQLINHQSNEFKSTARRKRMKIMQEDE